MPLDRSMKTQIERNVGRLAMVLAVNRTEQTYWERELMVDILGIQRISCKAGRDCAVPHGRDSDVVVGLVNAYIMQGMPENRTITLNVNELIRLSGLTVGGKMYAQVEESIERLYSVSYKMYDSWWDASRQNFTTSTLDFRIISRLHRTLTTPQPNVGRFTGKSELVLTLSEEIAESIQAGHLRALDPAIYASLTQPLARTVYRTLEEMRAPVGHQPMAQYQVRLMDWGLHLGLFTSTAPHPDKEKERRNQGSAQPNATLPPSKPPTATKVQRSLEPAHENLIAAGYLQEVEYHGRGQSLTVRYHFNDLATMPHPKIVLELTTRGVTPARAVTLAQEFGEEHVAQAVAQFDEIRARGSLKNPGGMLSDLLANPSKYRVSDDVRPELKPAAPKQRPEPRPTVNTAKVTLELPNPAAEWAALTPEAAMTRAKTLLGMLKLDEKDLKVFLQATSSGRLSGVQTYQVVDAVIKCRYAMASQLEVNAELHRQLSALLGEG